MLSICSIKLWMSSIWIWMNLFLSSRILKASSKSANTVFFSSLIHLILRFTDSSSRKIPSLVSSSRLSTYILFSSSSLIAIVCTLVWSKDQSLAIKSSTAFIALSKAACQDCFEASSWKSLSFVDQFSCAFSSIVYASLRLLSREISVSIN